MLLLNLNLQTVGSICSGIEAASVAWKDCNLSFQWFSEIEKFPSLVLEKNYPSIRNVGDMVGIPSLLESGELIAPDVLCAGTPCQAFSLAGSRGSLNDTRWNLTLKYLEIANMCDEIRHQQGKRSSVIFWENVEGVLNVNDNAFGCFISELAGLPTILQKKKWKSSGIIHGPKRNVAWRVLDAKHFGVPQQRKRLYLLAGDTDFYPENILFEHDFDVHDKSVTEKELSTFKKPKLQFSMDNNTYELFKDYTDCLCASYGRSWNGNSAAYNGSLFVAENGELRRFTPLECERLMGFPDNYTYLENTKMTPRYKSLGNSWAVPVVRWIGERLFHENGIHLSENKEMSITKYLQPTEHLDSNYAIYLDLDLDTSKRKYVHTNLNVYHSTFPLNPLSASYENIIDSTTPVPKQLFLSERGRSGILRRAEEKNLLLNDRLAYFLKKK